MFAQWNQWYRSVSTWALLVALVLLAPAALGGAAYDQNTARGFAGKAYQLGEPDSVNLFNGNLTVRLPLGQSYTVSPTLSYQFILTANSKVWDYQQTLPNTREAIPETFSNSGMGWNLSLGRLYQPPQSSTWSYVGPDGSSHGFSKAGATANDKYTEDGSYLYLQMNYQLADGTVVHRVHFPDGLTKEFYKEKDDATLRAKGSLRRIEDRFGNFVEVAYSIANCTDPTNVQGTCNAVWTITDGHNSTSSGRSHVVTFANKFSKYSMRSSNYYQVVSTVDLAAFGSASQDRSVYSFHYADETSGVATEVPTVECGGNHVYDATKVPLLSSVTLPDSSVYAMQYALDPQIDGTCNAASLKQLSLPTGGKVAWEYGDYESTKDECDTQDYWFTSYGGVTKRSFYRSASDTQPAVWTYTPRVTPRGTTYPDDVYDQQCGGTLTSVPPAAEELTTTVIDPVGNKTVHYFSVYPATALASHGINKMQEYGLPLSRKQQVTAADSQDLFISSEVYDGTTVKHKTYVAYDTDDTMLGGFTKSQLQRQRVVDAGDTACGTGSDACWTDSKNETYDGYGHYKKTTTSSNLPGSVDRITYTNYTPDTGSWILGLYDKSWVKEGAKARRSKSVFDSLTGALQSTRTWRDTSVDPTTTQWTEPNTDLLTLLCRNARGFVTSERYYGGDLAAIPSSPGCTTDPGTGHYVINHTYDAPSGAIIGHKAQYQGTSHYVVDEDFDVNTGKVSASRDSAGIETTFFYDKSGRLTAVKPAGEASTTYKYELPTATAPLTLTVRNCTPGSSSCETGSLTETKFFYDGLGRLTQERLRMPGGQWSARWTTYDALGRATRTSVPVQTSSGTAGSDTSTAGTTWTYDFMGRVLKETRPDAGSTRFVYTGSREKQIFSGNETLPRSTEQYDGAGRLRKVIQPSGPTVRTGGVVARGADVTTEYGYDFADRLLSVAMTGTESSTPQTRSFVYDGVGFLNEETHPESSTFTYEGYDARGHATKRLPVETAPLKFKQKYTWDAAERLVRVDTGNPAWAYNPNDEFLPTKTFVFATDNTNLAKGKLEKATRENFSVCDPTACYDQVRVVETYQYDSSGRKKSRVTEILQVPNTGTPVLIKSITQDFTYNTLGLPDAVKYPVCNLCGVPAGSDPQRNVSLSYSEGLLQSVGGYADLSYGPTGAVTGIAHQNGIADTIALDSSGRPHSITFNTWSSCGAPPSIIAQPGDQTVESGNTGLVSVLASGTSLQYQLYEATGSGTYTGATLIQSNGNGQFTTPQLTTTKFYFVRISNACKTIDSRIATVTVTSCSSLPSSVSVSPSSPSPYPITTPGTTVTLSVTATSATSWQWYQGYSGDTSIPVGTNSSSFTTPPLYASKRYWVRVSNSCGSKNSNSVKLSLALPAPTNLVASKVTGSNLVKLTWSPSAGAVKYAVYRRWGTTSFNLLDGSAQSPWYDTQATPGKAYVYMVRAVDVDGDSQSLDSNKDVATVMTFTTIVSNATVIDDAHLEELRIALNALRAANSMTALALSWADLLAGTGVPAPGPGVGIYRKHVEVLRSNFNATLQQLLEVSSMPNYTNPDLVAEPTVRAIHLTEIQERAK